MSGRGRGPCLVLALVASLLLAACGGDGAPDRSTGTTGRRPEKVDRLRLAGGTVGYPSPFAYIRGQGLVHTGLLFDTLLWKDASGRPIPWLASRWEKSPDGREWRFILREGVSWHDGRPLTAEDVVFTFEYFTKGAGRTATGVLGPLEYREVVAESPTSVLFRLDRPFAPFEVNVAGRVPIIPRHVWADVTEPAKLREPRAVMGSGPYRLESVDEAAGTYLYTANPSYFLGAPYVRRLEFVPAPDELRALERNELDAAIAFGLEEGVPPEALRPFEGPRFGMVTAPGELTRALHVNLARGFPYSDKRFRQAAAFAVDRKDLVTRVLLGRGEPGSLGYLAPSNEFAAKGLPSYDRDVGRARSLLDELGLRDGDGDGFRDLPDGRPFAPELLTNASLSSHTPTIVKEHLRDVGINVTIRSLDNVASDAAAAQGNYDMAVLLYGGLGGDPDVMRTRMSARIRQASFFRVHRYDNPRFEDLAAQQLVTLDGAERRRLVEEMQRIVAEDVPVIPLYLPTRVTVFTKGVFDAWYFTPGGVFGAYPGALNKHVLVTGKREGF